MKIKTVFKKPYNRRPTLIRPTGSQDLIVILRCNSMDAISAGHLKNNFSINTGFYFVHHFHSFNDANNSILCNAVTYFNKNRVSWRWRMMML